MDADKLPTLPHVLLNLLAVCQEESVSSEQLADVIRKDPALCVKIISVAQGKDTDINHFEKLLLSLDINTIKSIAITSAVQQFFSRSHQERISFLKQHWFHSIMCACVAESLASVSEYKQTEEAWFAGLLHDTGQLIMEAAYPSKYTTTFAQLSEDEYFHDLEKEEFDTTHYQVGADLLRKHYGNPFLADAIMYHHEPVELIRDAHPLVKIVNLANMLSSDHYRDNPEPALSAADQLFGLSKKTVKEILSLCNEQVQNIALEFDVDFSSDDVDGDTAQQISANDNLKQVELAEQIRNIAMLDGVHQHLSRTEGKQALLQALQRNISILFGINHTMLFLYDAATDEVQALAESDSDAHLQDIHIPLEAGRSIVTDCLLEKSNTSSFDEEHRELSIIDHQLVGLNHREGLLCLPLIVNNAAIGAIVLGIDEAQLPALLKQHGLLTRFAHEVANTISSSFIEYQQPDTEDKDDAEEMRLRAREVAHEVRNPLSVINNYIDILRFKLGSDDPAHQDLDTIKEEISRVNTILEKLSQPVEVDASEITLVDVNALIADLSHMFQTSLFAAHNVEISLNLDEHLPPMLTNADALKQIYTNLVKNAVEALPAEGLVMVYTQDQVNVDGKAHYEICVADDGPGIPAEILPDLFTPIQTTKGDEHAGLGLTIVKNLVNELHGSISCRSSNKGTSFHILLPRNLQE